MTTWGRGLRKTINRCIVQNKVTDFGDFLCCHSMPRFDTNIAMWHRHNNLSRRPSITISRANSYCMLITGIYVACNLRTCAVCRLHGAKYAVCRLHGTQSADCMATVQTNSFSKFQRNLLFSARINFLTKLPNLMESNLCLFDNGYYSFSCL